MRRKGGRRARRVSSHLLQLRDHVPDEDVVPLRLLDSPLHIILGESQGLRPFIDHLLRIHLVLGQRLDDPVALLRFIFSK